MHTKLHRYFHVHLALPILGSFSANMQNNLSNHMAAVARLFKQTYSFLHRLQGPDALAEHVRSARPLIFSFCQASSCRTCKASKSKSALFAAKAFKIFSGGRREMGASSARIACDPGDLPSARSAAMASVISDGIQAEAAQ